MAERTRAMRMPSPRPAVRHPPADRHQPTTGPQGPSAFADLGWSPPASVLASRLIDLQRTAGNAAVATYLQRAQVGWPDAKGANKDAATVAGTKVERIPISGLAGGNQKASPDDKTNEAADGRGVLLLPLALVPSQPIDAFVHFHGLTGDIKERPYPGYREVTNPGQYGGPGVRDVELDKVAQQIDAGGNPQVVGVLPQGTGGADFANLDPDKYTAEMLDVAKTRRAWKEAPSKVSVILGAHSAGGHTLAHALQADEAGRKKGELAHLRRIVLFEANIGESTIKTWVEGQLSALKTILSEPTTVDADKLAAVHSTGLKGYFDSSDDSYTAEYGDLKTWLPDQVKALAKAFPAYADELRGRFSITEFDFSTKGEKVPSHHEHLIGGVTGGKGAAGAPLQDAMSHLAAPAPAAVQPKAASGAGTTVQRDAPPQQDVAVTVSWTGHLENAGQLQPVLTAHPPDLDAEVSEGSTVLGHGKGSAVVHLSKTPAKHTLRVRPTATAASQEDYYLPGHSDRIDVTQTTSVDVTLPFNRENQRFTEQTWVAKGLDPAKVKDVHAKTLFDHQVEVNTRADARVDAANAYLAAHYQPAEQQVAKNSIISIGGYNLRTQSRGTYSNHSAGVAVDINPNEEYQQNQHLHSGKAPEARAMRVFNETVRSSLVERILVQLGVPAFEVWQVGDRDSLLAASQQFNVEFPAHLHDLLVDADSTLQPPSDITIMRFANPAMLKRAAKKATAAHKAATASALTDLSAADTWKAVRGWVEGIVKTGRTAGGEDVFEIQSDFDNDPHHPANLGTLQGMISLHPALVMALTESGWTWLVQSHTEKDFMHFEDRAAEAALV
jgi:hypothetical protein